MLQLKIEDIKWETADTATFYLKEADGKKTPYQAGQFLTLVFTHHHEEIRRSYSISSSPDEDRLAISIKRMPNGEISRLLLSKTRIGDTIYAAEPAGKFVIAGHPPVNDIIYFAAGSGIVPIFSQLKYLLKRPANNKLTLIYSNIDENHIIFKTALNALEKNHPDRFKIIYLLSSEARRLNNIMAEKLIHENLRQPLTEVQFYLCGPFTYMRMVWLTLYYMGVDKSQIHKENFVLETVPVTGPTHNFAPRNIRIDFNNELHILQVGENQSILQAALQNGIKLPYSCLNGICSACTAICQSGRVEMVKNEVLTDKDLAEGSILTCTGHPLTDDVVISYH